MELYLGHNNLGYEGATLLAAELGKSSIVIEIERQVAFQN